MNMNTKSMYVGGDGVKYYVGPNKLVSALITIALLLVITFVVVFASYEDTHYHTTAKVYSVEEGGTLFIDGTGNVWIAGTAEAYKVGEFVELYFDNNRTDYTRNDDIIIKVKRLDN